MIIFKDVIFDESKTLRLNIKDARWDDYDDHEVATLYKDNNNDDEDDEITSFFMNEEYYSHDFDDCSQDFDVDNNSKDEETTRLNRRSNRRSQESELKSNRSRSSSRNIEENDQNRWQNHSNLSSDDTISDRDTRKKHSSQKKLLNEYWSNIDNWAKMITALVKKRNLSKLFATFEAAYCRLATIRKTTVKNCQYVRDFDLDMKFNELLRVAQVYNVETTSSIDEEPLTYKQAMKGPFVAQWKIVDDAKIEALKDMRTYVRVERSQISKDIKVLKTRMWYISWKRTCMKRFFATKLAASFKIFDKFKTSISMIFTSSLSRLYFLKRCLLLLSRRITIANRWISLLYFLTSH